MDIAVRSAIAASHLRELPVHVVAELVVGARRLAVPPGAILHREGEVEPHVELVLSGLERVFVTAPDGRTLTIRYVRQGALLGVLSLFADGFRMPATIQAIAASEVLVLRPSVVIGIADRHAGWPVPSCVSRASGSPRSSPRSRAARSAACGSASHAI